MRQQITHRPNTGKESASFAGKRAARESAFTLLELLAAIVCCAILAVIAYFVFAAPGHAKARRIKCSTYVRGHVQAMITWAGSNNGDYPLPSAVDLKNDTVVETGSQKNTTANIFSLMIYNGLVTSETTVCDTEQHTDAVRLMRGYAMSNPKAAIRPASALWDPAFRADFTDTSRPGNVSYAHLLPAGARRALWKATHASNQAVIGDRGPEFGSLPDRGRVIWKNKASWTLLNHGGRSTWEGCIGYNDGNVQFETKGTPDSITYQPVGSSERKRDVLFWDEPDDAEGTNAFLGIFTKAGDKPGEFKAIWD